MAEKKTTRKKSETTEEVVKTTKTEKHHDFQCEKQEEVVINEGENSQSLTIRLQDIVNKYEEHISTAIDFKDLETEYGEVLRQMTEYNAKLSEKSYNLVESIEFEGTTYNRKQLGEKIVFFLTKEAVKFADVTRMRNLKNAWNNVADTIGFETYHNTVVFLNGITYRGVREWEGVQMVSAYFSTLAEEYAKDTVISSYWNAKKRIIEDASKRLQGK